MDSCEENCKIIEAFLQRVLEERKHNSIVIHEAVEALGNLSPDNTKELLASFDEERDDMIVKETCELALDLTKWKEETKDGETEGIDLKKLKHITNDPSPPFNPETSENYRSVEWLTEYMLNPKNRLFDRYRAIFTLREMHTDESVLALCKCLAPENRDNCSPLLKHEIGFVFGQLGHEIAHEALSALEASVNDPTEDPIVRHECVIALGDISKDKSVMEKYFTDKDDMVRESCLVASDMVDYWKE